MAGFLGSLPRLSFPLCFLAVETSLLVHWRNIHNVHVCFCFLLGRLVVFIFLRPALYIYGRIACYRRPHYASGFLSPGFGSPCTPASSTLLDSFQGLCTIFFSTPPPKLSFCRLLYLLLFASGGYSPCFMLGVGHGCLRAPIGKQKTRNQTTSSNKSDLDSLLKNTFSSKCFHEV